MTSALLEDMMSPIGRYRRKSRAQRWYSPLILSLTELKREGWILVMI